MEGCKIAASVQNAVFSTQEKTMKGLASTAIAMALLGLAGSACARNDKLLLPIEPALKSPGTRQLLGADVQLRFGKASAVGLEALSTVQAHAVVSPYGPVNTNAGGRTDRRSDPLVCLDAFRKAAMDLQQRARSVGGSGVTGIVSFYNGAEMDSTAVYECHIGHTRGVVTLKGQAVRSLQPAQQPAAVTPITPITPVQPAAVVMAPAVGSAAQPARIATGYAAIDDVDAVPYLSDKGRADYRQWLGRPTPRAFAISPKGHWWAAYSLTPADTTLPSDPTERALVGCERAAQMPCKLYAINGSVVWVKDPR
jgi:hypothetical protein